MELLLLTAELVEAIHDEVLNPGELPGMAMNKSLDSALARVDNRIAYGMIDDLFDIAAMYAMAIAQGHCFNDANKRTAHQSMDAFLDLNGVQITWSAEEIGQKIIALAQGLIDDGDLAEWLRGTA
ncbi:type II toxin-antitoxin system death-on-curing family toxin [Paracoccus alkanivorans]|uniref:Type II toxin-antitoxin system death-on-curing family toxin n=1 Tax=Paracoccus alkanivorans TaxID=2116655 RepID=A0A3M0M7T7_9RHOB|nr:type II toxin-antitoxin system death-on-curing family toxin [Paracoccus alkanivorans]RMC33858.1 type II toxin-antitoxin system death-on-curing family toxin [Paracoccus alkanivorans]